MIVCQEILLIDVLKTVLKALSLWPILERFTHLELGKSRKCLASQRSSWSTDCLSLVCYGTDMSDAFMAATLCRAIGLRHTFFAKVGCQACCVQEENLQKTITDLTWCRFFGVIKTVTTVICCRTFFLIDKSRNRDTFLAK